MSLYKGSTCIARTTNVSGKANTWLDNLTDVGEDRLNTSKMYLTGGVSTDEKGYNQLLEMKHSTSSKSGIDIVNINNAEVEIPYTLSKTGSKIVDVAYRDKVIELYEQEGQADYFTIDEVNKNFTLPMGEIYGMAVRKDLSNLSEVGEKHFLNKSQITNCLLEVPQRIKLELNNGTLTLKAGSEVIVPNGFEADGVTPKFDYVTVERDVSWTSSTTAGTRLGFYIIGTNTFIGNVNTYIYSGDTAKMNSTSAVTYGRFYNTETNKIYVGNSNGGSWVEATGTSLPICIFTNDANGVVTSLNQIFDGIGFIGSTIWADKGVKGLIPNGRNEDGSLNNIEFTTQNILLRNNTSGNGPAYLVIVDGGTRVSIANKQNWVFDEKSNRILENGVIRDNIGFYGDITLDTGGVITSFNPKLPFRAADYNDIDGKYTYNKRLVVSSKEDLSVANGVNVNYNLSEFLPKDNNSYLVLTSITVQTGASAGSYCHVWTTSSDNVEGISCGGNTTSAARQTFISRGWTLVRPDRILRTFRSCSGSAGILYTLEIAAYRKVR